MTIRVSLACYQYHDLLTPPPKQGNLQDPEESAEFIKGKFVELAGNVEVITHITCAIDTDAISLLWLTTREVLLKRAAASTMVVMGF
jgi:hypothetical protein